MNFRIISAVLLASKYEIYGRYIRNLYVLVLQPQCYTRVLFCLYFSHKYKQIYSLCNLPWHVKLVVFTLKFHSQSFKLTYKLQGWAVKAMNKNIRISKIVGFVQKWQIGIIYISVNTFLSGILQNGILHVCKLKKCQYIFCANLSLIQL